MGICAEFSAEFGDSVCAPPCTTVQGDRAHFLHPNWSWKSWKIGIKIEVHIFDAGMPFGLHFAKRAQEYSNVPKIVQLCSPRKPIISLFNHHIFMAEVRKCISFIATLNILAHVFFFLLQKKTSQHFPINFLWVLSTCSWVFLDDFNKVNWLVFF